MVMPEFERDFHCMSRIPKENKCSIECLLDYQFDNINFTCIEHYAEGDMLFFGTNKGSILSYFLRVTIDDDDECSK
jgi:hypothetical protein